MKWKKGRDTRTLFGHHEDYGPLVTETEFRTLNALSLGVTVPYSHEGWEQLSCVLTMKNLRKLNSRLAARGVLSTDSREFVVEGWKFTILNHRPYNLNPSSQLEAEIRARWEAGTETIEGNAKVRPFALYPGILGHKGYLYPSDMFARFDEIVLAPSGQINAVVMNGESWTRHSKNTIDGIWVFDESGKTEPTTAPSSSIDAGMPGNEDGAWGSSTGDGWRVD